MSSCSISFAFLALGILLTGATPAAGSESREPAELVDPALVRVSIVTRTQGTADTVEFNGKLPRNYSPTFIQVFSATGIVLNRHGYIMTFLGYRWVDLQDRDAEVEVTSGEGQKWKGRLVGIDQSNGVAVIRLQEGKLKQTPICRDCEVKDGSTVMAPVIAGSGFPQLHEAQVVSVGTSQSPPYQGRWTITMNSPFPDIGQPILDSDHRVLGFIASQDPMSAQTVVYPIAPLLSSAEKIIKKGGDIQVGWLGIFIMDSDADGSGIRIEDVGQDSPAQKAGLSPYDLIVKYDGKQIKDSLQFIQLVESTPIGSKVKLKVLRQGSPMTVTAVIEPRKPQPTRKKLSFKLPGLPGPPANGKLHPRPFVGLDTILLTPSLAKALQIPREEGLLVVNVAEQTPADQAGVLVGDIIIAMDGKPIKDPLRFSSYLGTLNWGAQLILKVLRKGSELTIPVQLPAHKR